MFNRLAFKALNFALLASLVISKPTNQCDEFKKLAEKNKKSYDISECKLNSEGKITNLNIISDEKKMSKSEFEILSKFTDIEELNIQGPSSLYIEFNDLLLLKSLKSLKSLNLDGVNIHYEEGTSKYICSELDIERIYVNKHVQSCSQSNNQCKQLKKDIEDLGEDSESIVRYCNTDRSGKLTVLTVDVAKGGKKLNSKVIEKIFSYNTITELEYYHDYSTIEKDEFPISRLTNLDQLTIVNSNHGHSSEEVGESGRGARRFGISKNIIKSIPKSVKILELNGIALTQKNIDELVTLTQLEQLTLYELNLNELSLNFDGFKKLSNVSQLVVSEESDIKRAAFKIITKFTNVSALDLEGTLHPLSFKEEDLKLLKNMKNLRFLNVKNTFKDEEALENICSLTNIEYLMIDGKEVKSCEASQSQSPKISTNGQCGKEYGVCPSGNCCSKYGWCGTSSEHCGKGCQSEFGKCN